MLLGTILADIELHLRAAHTFDLVASLCLFYARRMADRMSKMPCAEQLTLALRGMGLVEQPGSTQQHGDDVRPAEPNLMMQGTPPIISQVLSTFECMHIHACMCEATVAHLHTSLESVL